MRIFRVCRIPSLEWSGDEIIPFKITLFLLHDSTTLSTLAVTPNCTSLEEKYNTAKPSETNSGIICTGHRDHTKKNRIVFHDFLKTFFVN